MSGQGQLAYSLYHWIWTSLDWVYPPRCGGCGESGSRWCTNCQRDVILVEPPICPICGRKTHHDEICHACRLHKPEYTSLRSWGVFTGPLQSAVHRLKYHRDVALGEALAGNMIICLSGFHWPVDLVVPVPLGVARQAERGYNQAALLARPVALANHLAYSTKALWRTRETRSQVGLSLEQRWENVADSFSADPEKVKGKTVLVVDDVATSGATLDACAAALHSASANQIFALTLARAL